MTTIDLSDRPVDSRSYRDRLRISQSDLKLFAKSPLLYYRQKIAKTVLPDPPTPAMLFGSRVETWVRAKGATSSQLIIPDEYLMSGARRGKPWEIFKSIHPDHSDWQTAREFDRATESMRDIYASIQANPIARELLLDPVGDGQDGWHHRIDWTCPASGLPRKAELDRLVNDRTIIADLKCVSDPTPRVFFAQSYRLGYAVQAATYVEAVGPNSEFIFVAVRSKEPHDVWCYRMSPELLDAGSEWNHTHMLALSRCYDSNDWTPSIEYDGEQMSTDRVNMLRLPRYATSVYESSVDTEDE